MRFLPILILIIAVKSFSISPINYYWTVNLAGDNVSVKKLKYNYDSIQIKFNALRDTMNSTVPRWLWFTDHTKIFPWMNIDTISGKVIMDTIKIDSIETRTIKYTGLVFASSGDSCVILKNGVPTLITAANLRIMSGAASTAQLADSAGTKLNGTLNSGYIPKATGSKSTANSVIYDNSGKIGIGTTTAAQPLQVVRTGGLPATSGTTSNAYFRLYENSGVALDMGLNGSSPYQSWIQAVDPANLSTGYPLVLNPVAGNVGIGDLTPDAKLDVAGKAIIDSLLTVDTISVTKGISATIGRFTGALFGTSATFTGTVGIDSINATKRISAPKGITTNNRDTLTYEDTTFYDSLYEGVTYKGRSLARIVCNGATVTLYQPEMLYSLTGGSLQIKGIPAKYNPRSTIKVAAPVQSNSTESIGAILYISGTWLVTPTPNTGVGGVIGMCCSWIK